MSGFGGFLRVEGRLTTAAVVIGAGVVIGVSGLYVYFSRQQQLQLAHLTRTIEGLRKDVGELKMVAAGVDRAFDAHGADSCNTNTRRRVGSSSTSSHCTTTRRTLANAQSASGDENNGEIYFDVSDDDNYNTAFNSVNYDRLEPANDDGQHSASTATSTMMDFTEIDTLLDNAVDNELVYGKLATLKNQGMTDPEFIWRLVRACYLCFQTAGRLGDTQRQKDLIAEGIQYSIAGLAIDNNHPDIHKWYAVILGRSTEFLGIQEKIKNGFKFKEHLDLAIKFRPDDRMLHFMKGRWCYEVSMLTWVERNVAAALFSTPPTSSLDEARQQFLKVEQLYPLKWKENLLFIAKCLIGERNYKEAMVWLNKAATVNCESPDEEATVEIEVQQLLSKYRKYDA